MASRAAIQEEILACVGERLRLLQEVEALSRKLAEVRAETNETAQNRHMSSDSGTRCMTRPLTSNLPSEPVADHGRGAGSRKLVLHFDVNETIMIGDPAAGHNFNASLNNVIAKVAIVRKKQDSDEYEWHDGSPLDPSKRCKDGVAPALLFDFHLPAGCKRFFEVLRENAPRFTEPGSHGEIYRPQFEALLQKLRWDAEPHGDLSHDGNHKLLPAFFHTLHELARRGRDFTLVVRTFGTDLPMVSAAVSAFARGEHPDFPLDDAALQRLQLPLSEVHWALRRSDRKNTQSAVALRRYGCQLGSAGFGADLSTAMEPETVEEVIDNEDDISHYLAKLACIGVRDDYHFWKGHDYAPEAGKPLWITAVDDDIQHIFFDDNIHNKDHSDYDTIVSVRARGQHHESFRAVPLDSLNELQGILFVKAHPVAATLDRDYFLRHIDECERGFAAARTSGRLEQLLLRSYVTGVGTNT